MEHTRPSLDHPPTLPTLVAAGRPLVRLSLSLHRERRRLEELLSNPSPGVAHRAHVLLVRLGETLEALSALVGALAAGGAK